MSIKTAGELIAELQKYPADFPVALAVDAEGNGFKRLDEVDITNLDLDEMEHYYSYDDDDNEIEVEPNVAIIWPI